MIIKNKIFLIMALASFFSFTSLAGNSKNQKIVKIKFIKPKTTMKQVEVTRTSFHGKKLKRKFDTTINHKTNEKELNKYLEDVKKFLNDSLPVIESSKFKAFMVKIQIQKNGGTDILFINSPEEKVNTYIYESFSKLGEILPIPKATGQSEIQIELYFI